MKTLYYSIIASSFLVSGFSSSALAYSLDTSAISNMYVTTSGEIAIYLTNNFPNARASGQCNTSSGWASNPVMSNAMKATLIAARSVDKPITVAIEGCFPGNAWYKIIDIYY